MLLKGTWRYLTVATLLVSIVSSPHVSFSVSQHHLCPAASTRYWFALKSPNLHTYILHWLLNVSVEIQRFGFIGLHAKPEDAPEEIDSLVDVYDGMVGIWGVEVG